MHNDFAVLLNQMDRKVLALPFLRAASALVPESDIANDNLDTLSKEVAHIVLLSQVESLQRKLSSTPAAADHVALAKVFWQIGEHSKTVEQLEKAVRLDGDSIEYQYELAQAWGERGSTKRRILRCYL